MKYLWIFYNAVFMSILPIYFFLVCGKMSYLAGLLEVLVLVSDECVPHQLHGGGLRLLEDQVHFAADLYVDTLTIKQRNEKLCTYLLKKKTPQFPVHFTYGGWPNLYVGKKHK